MCRLEPILHARCPSAAKDEGALPGIGKANGSNMRTVDIPSLAALGSRSPDVEERGQGQPVPEEKCTQENVYNVLRDAEPFPSAQQRLDFGQLLDVSARTEASGRALHGSCILLGLVFGSYTAKAISPSASSR